MAEQHAFARAMDFITEFDGGDEDVVLRQKPKYARQLAMMDEESRMPDHPVENKTKEDWPEFYDVTVMVSLRRDCMKNTRGMKKESTDGRH